MNKKKIHFVTEGIVDGEPIQSEKFNQIVNPDTEKIIFDDVFQITECKDFEKYRDKNEFLATVLEMAISYFEDFGDIIIHIFDKENRLFYDLERIWRDGKTIEPDTLKKL